MTALHQADDFDLKLAIECATAFSGASGLGCTVSDASGQLLYHTGYSCEQCRICTLADKCHERCVQAHIYGMVEAERFGGKYIYFCPMGLTCFVSPILGHHGSSAKITVGPFLMGEREDQSLVIEEHAELSADQRQALAQELEIIPEISTAKVQALSSLLFMAVGFMNNVSAASRMLEIQTSDAVLGQISEYIRQIKGGEELPRYPIDSEQALLGAIAQSNKPEASRLLNELLGHIFFCCGGQFTTIKSSASELLVLISRAAISGGADCERTLYLSRSYLSQMNDITNLDDLCSLLVDVMTRLIDSVFVFENIRHADVIHKAIQYMRNHYTDKLTLEETARVVYLSPSYFSKVFKEETGTSWNRYLNTLRIEKSKSLLLSNNMRLSEISAALGFEDQSYFTKVFKGVTGVSPNQYRDKIGRI